MTPRVTSLGVALAALGAVACGGAMQAAPAADAAPAPAAAAESPAAAPAADLSGSWTLSVTLSSGPGTRQVMFFQDGNELTGTISSSRATGELTGTVLGDRVEFVAVVGMASGDFEIVYKARVEGDRLVEGSVEIPGYGGGSFTGVRKDRL